MEALPLLQLRAVRQVIQSTSLQPRQVLRQFSSNSFVSPQQCLRRPQLRSRTYRSASRAEYHTSFTSSPFSRLTRRFHSTHTISGTTSAAQEPLSLSQRMRKLSREYGYSALGVYIALTALDLPFCYLAVSYLGSERIARWEHAVLSYIKSVAKWPMGKEGEKIVDEGADHVQRKVPLEEVQGREDGAKRVLAEDQTYMLEDHGYMEAEKANQGDNASFWTKLALAYAIHKSFIFARIPLTAAVTPKVVKTLRSWGWNIGKMPKKRAISGGGVNTGKTGVKPEK